MAIFTVLNLIVFLLASRVSSQTVQDDWLLPSMPDKYTTLKSGNKYAINWKPGLKDNFATYCEGCDTSNVDLWIVNSDHSKYTSKIAHGLDVTTTQTYDWVVNIDSDKFSIKDSWGFRFVPYDSEIEDESGGDISSPAFRISGLEKESSSTSQSTTSSSSNTATPTPTPTSNTSTAGPEKETNSSDKASSNTALIAGAVAGPIIGIALGAVLVWFCLRKRKNKKLAKGKEIIPTYETDSMTKRDVKTTYAHTGTPAPPYAVEAPGERNIVEAPGERNIVEAPDNSTTRLPAELA